MATRRTPRQPSAIVPPGRPHDPEGTEPLIARASAEYGRRLQRVRRRYVEFLEALPRHEYEPAGPLAVSKRYTYDLDPETLRRAGELVEEELMSGGTRAPWLFEAYVRPAVERGAARAWRNLSRQSPAYKAQVPTLRALLDRPEFRRRIALVRARVFEEMRGFTDSVRTSLSRLLADGVARGQSPARIAQTLREQLPVDRHRAERIARTEVNTALRRARWDETEDAHDAYGLETREMHLSALSPTTRQTHADRHGKLYTMEETRAWFAEGANSINCKCTTVAVMVDDDGQPLAPILTERAAAARERYDAKRAAAREAARKASE